MGALFYLIPYGFILQVIAIVHFIRRRPDWWWLLIIIFGGGLGALVYIAVEIIPDANLIREDFKFFPRRRRIGELQALVVDNPSAANLEELGALYLEDKKYGRARECFDRAIASRADSIDTFYRRALAEIGMNDWIPAIQDLERVTTAEPKYDFYRAAGLLAEAYAQTGQNDRARTAFERVTAVSTSTEIQYYYAAFLARQGESATAREWLQRISAKKRTMPGFQKRRDRPWFRKATALSMQVR